MKIFVKRAILIGLCICLCVSLFGCDDKTGLAEKGDIKAVLAPMENAWLDELSGKTSDFSDAVIPDYSGGDTLNIGTGETVSYVNPFYPGNAGETAASDLVSVKLFDTDREGSVVLSGRSGETKEHNETEYTYYGIADGEVSGNTLSIELRDDIYFSDGVNLTADDVIFSMYVLADPAYDGSSGFALLPVSGMSEYRGGMEQKWKLILEDLSESTEYNGSSCYTKEEFDSFLSAFNEVGLGFTKEIIEESVNIFAEDYSGFVLNRTASQIRENEGLKIAFAEYFCGYAKGLNSTDGLWYDSAGKSYDLEENYPTTEEFWELILSNRGYDISDDGINYEKLGDRDFADILLEKLNESDPGLAVAVACGESADRITGIEKTGMYSLRLTFDKSPLDFLNSLCIPVCPLHYYGSRDSYKYTDNRFGFTKGDLTSIKAADTPLGGGAYIFGEYTEGGAALSRNKGYFLGCPKITNINIGDVDYEISLSMGNSGDATVDSDRFVCIGISGSRVNVGGEDCSEASVSLRRAFCTMFEAYKNQASEEYEVQSASFSEKETADKSEENTEDATGAALSEAAELLKQAGFTWNEGSGRFTAAPDGASLNYEIRIFKDDAASMAAKLAAEDLSEIGITLDVFAHSSVEALVNFVNSGGADMWVMSVSGGIKDIIDSMFYEDGNVFWVNSDELDSQVKALDTFDSQSDRNVHCREIINRLSRLGVFVPIYRETNWVSYSDTVIEESITPDMTESWTWLREIYLLEMK